MDSKKPDFIFTRERHSCSQSMTPAHLGIHYLPHVGPLNLVQLKAVKVELLYHVFLFPSLLLQPLQHPRLLPAKSMLMQKHGHNLIQKTVVPCDILNSLNFVLNLSL